MITVLQPGDYDHRAIRALVAHYTERLALLRRENDAPSLDERKTARKRGQIEEVKALLRLIDPEHDADSPATVSL